MRPPGAPRDVALEVPPALSGPAATMGASAAPGLPERLRLPVCFLGVFACYFYYGILQESITRGRYGEGAKQEKFKYALTLVFIQCVINAAFAKLRNDSFRGRGTAGPHAGLALRGLLAVLPGRHGVQQLRPAVRQLPHPGAGQVLQTHPSDAAGGDPAEEEVPPSQVPVRAAHRGRGGPVPLQAQKRDRGHRAHLWLRGAAPAAVTDPGRAHGGVPGPHEGSLPDRLQPHDAQRQPLVHAVPGGRDPVHGGALGVPEFHGALSQHHLQHPPLRPHQRPGPEFHLHDRGVLRTPDLLHHHHHPQVLHHPGLRGALCQPHQPHAVGGHRPGVPGPWARCQIREGGEEDVALRWIGRSRSWNELLIYCLVPQNLVWNWTQDRESEGNRVGFIFGLSLVWFFNSEWFLKCNPLV